MRYIFIFSLFAILFLFSCGKTSKETTSAPSQEKKQEVIVPDYREKPVRLETYETFYHRFHSDSIFQISRIKFPLQGHFNDSVGDTQIWDKKNWIMHRSEIQQVDTSIYKVELHNSGNLSTEILSIEGSGFKTERRFSRIEGKWFLVFYIDDNY